MNTKLKFNVYKLCQELSIKQMKSLGFFNLNNGSLSRKYDICFEKINKGIIYDDSSAKNELGYTNTNTFQRFKHRFTERVKSYIFLIDVHRVRRKDEEEVYKNLWREVALAKILTKSKNIKNARAIYVSIYPKVKEYEFIDLAIIILSSLEAYYAYISPKKRLYNYYANENKAIQNHNLKQNLCEKYYNEISHFSTFNDFSSSSNLSRLSLKYYEELKKLFKDDDFIRFRTFAIQLGTFGYQLNGQHEKAINLNNEALDFLTKRPKSTVFFKYIIMKDILKTYLVMKKYDRSLSYITEIESIGLSYNFNYFSLQSLKYQVLAYKGRYNELYTLTQFILSLKELKKNDLRLEQWKIKEAFVHFLVAVGKVDEQLVTEKPLKAFRLRRFINEMELHGKDKRGANIAIHVLQLLFYLKDKDYSKVGERLDALTQYTYRYLRNDATLRSNCFIKMLLKLPEADYNPIRTKRYVNKYWKKLQENPLDISLQSSEVEVIPYEHLWEMVIEMISGK